MDTKDSISNEALARVSRLIRDILGDPRSVVAVSPLIVSAALKIGVRVTPPAAQAVSILLIAVCNACLEHFRNKGQTINNESCVTQDSDDPTSPSDLHTSKLIH